MALDTLRGRFRQYHFPPLDAETAQPHPQDDEQQHLALVAEHQLQLKEGYQEGFKRGLEEGQKEGHEQGLRQGTEQGFNEGMRKGYTDGSLSAQKEGQQQFALASKPLDGIAQQVNDYLGTIQRKQRDDLLQLVEKVTRQVIRCELALQPTQLLSIIEEALSALPSVPESLQVMLSSEEFERIQNVAPEKVSEWGLTPAATLQSGECRIVTDTSELDVGCEHRLEQCMKTIKETLTPEQKDA